MRRVDCRRCEAVVVEEVPCGDGKRTLTNAYMLFLARWARRLSWKETAEAFHTSWNKVFDAVEHVATFGLGHRTLGQIGDEVASKIVFVCSDIWEPYLKVICEKCSEAPYPRFELYERMGFLKSRTFAAHVWEGF